MIDIKIVFTRVIVKEGFVDAGKEGVAIGGPINVNGLNWQAVLWNGEEDPNFFKAYGLLYFESFYND